MLEPLRILECQNVGQRDQRPYAVDLRQQFLLRVPLGNFLNLLVVFGDLLADRLHTLQQGSDHRLGGLAEPLAQVLFYLIGIALLQPFSHRFHQPPRAVDQPRSGFHQLRPRPDHSQVRLCFCASVTDR
jgi:hypothetical protein